MQTITPFLWFATQAEEAAALYTSIFPDSSIATTTRYGEGSPGPAGSVMTVEMLLCGQHFTALNGGPHFSFTPAVSFFVHCDTAEEIDVLWKKLADGGKVLMALQAYPFSKYYGWLQDKFGVSWQIFLGTSAQKILPCLMFTGEQCGKAEEAMRLYMSLFAPSRVTTLAHYEPGEGHTKGTVKHARFTLGGQEFIAMDSGVEHAFSFTPATSFVVHCATQERVDALWEQLSSNKEAEQCGWLQDKFGVSWQIVPDELMTLLSDPDPAKAQRVMQAMLGMKKLDIALLRAAAKQA